MAGLAVGLLLAFGVAKAFTGLMFGVEATDPVPIGLTGLALGVVVLLASYVPARRASGVDPPVAFRSE